MITGAHHRTSGQSLTPSSLIKTVCLHFRLTDIECTSALIVREASVAMTFGFRFERTQPTISLGSPQRISEAGSTPKSQNVDPLSSRVVTKGPRPVTSH